MSKLPRAAPPDATVAGGSGGAAPRCCCCWRQRRCWAVPWAEPVPEGSLPRIYQHDSQQPRRLPWRPGTRLPAAIQYGPSAHVVRCRLWLHRCLGGTGGSTKYAPGAPLFSGRAGGSRCPARARLGTPAGTAEEPRFFSMLPRLRSTTGSAVSPRLTSSSPTNPRISRGGLTRTASKPSALSIVRSLVCPWRPIPRWTSRSALSM